ncbi:V-set and immunoglobulin domain-containing protein 10-like [Salarias fasciatus]|uniref:V-set and immunoglobulin domain-containing protein 10-like n=1 Tax=Salarias fasciatus TaxID=181472 RepID=A0A672FIR3_SALFA|nr:V-set and immunoglobulin domain-containing protein 10-like [Salarias fasciatus]
MDPFRLRALLLFSAVLGRAAASVLPDGPVDAVLGRNVTLETLLRDPQYAFIVWSFSDDSDPEPVATVGGSGSTTYTVSDPYKDRVSVNRTNGFLTLRGLRSADSGDYSINVIGADGVTRTGGVKLRVLEPVSEVLIKSDVPEAVEHNSTVVLICTAKGSFLNFTWLNGTAAVKADGRRVVLKEEEASSQLTFYGVLRTDLKGPLVCTAANKLETDKSAAFSLTVHYGPDDVQIRPSKPARFIRSRSSFNLSCSAVSSPAATFRWFYNEQQVQADGPVLPLETIEKLGHGQQEGSYTCVAANAKTGRAARSPPVTFGVMEPISGATLTGPSGVLIAGNHSANLSCAAAAGAVQTISWLKDGQPLRPGAVFSPDRSSVLLSPLLKEDNGKVSCRLSNPVNAEDAVFTLVVNYGPETPAVSGREAVEVEDPVTLTCSAPSQPPANYTWRFNGSLTAVKTATYTIDQARYSHSGTYLCEASNAVTGRTSSKAFTLSVKEELVEGLSDGAIAGIVIAVLVALGAAVALVFYCRQKVPVDSPY